MERESFVFYRSFFKALQALPAEEFKETILAVCEYALDGDEPDLEGVPYMAFELIRPQINANNNRYANGAKGGRPKKATVSEDEETEKPMVYENEKTEKPMVYENAETEKPNDNVNDNDNVNVNERKKGTTSPKKDPAAEIEEMGFSPDLEQAVKDWTAYKTEKRQGYKPTGFKSLLTRIKAEEGKHGSGAVVDAIQDAMSNGWQGIVWERIGARSPNDRKRTTRFVNYDQRQVDYDAMLREGDWR